MKSKRKNYIIMAGIALFVWTADAAIKAVLFREGSFPDLFLFSVPAVDFSARIVFISGLFLYLFATTRVHRAAGRKNIAAERSVDRPDFEQDSAELIEELRSANELLKKEIRDQARTEEELYRSENFLSSIFDSFHDPFAIISADYKIVKFNDAYMKMRNKSPRELHGKTCHEIFYKRNTICEDCIVEKTFLSRDPCAKEEMISLPGGQTGWVEIYTYPIFDPDRNVTHVIEYIRDITDRKKDEDEKKLLIENLNRLSTTDSLTGLLNRRALTDALNREIERSQRYESDLSLLICDVDRFKLINDTYGHAAGDRALMAVAKAIGHSVRRSDIIGRYGGDEFMIILPETSLDGARILAEKIRAGVCGILLDLGGGRKITLSISLGVADCCTALDNSDTLVRLADMALYTSKHEGRNRVSTAPV